MADTDVHTFYAVSFSDYMQVAQLAHAIFETLGPDGAERERPILFTDKRRTYANTGACLHIRQLLPDVAIDLVGVGILALPDNLSMMLGEANDNALYRSRNA